MARSDFTPEPYQQMLLFWAATAFALCINILTSTFLPKVEGFVLLLFFAGFFAVVLPLAILGEHQRPAQVFTKWINQGEFATQGLAFMVSLIGVNLIMSGADGAIHVSYEPTLSASTHCLLDQDVGRDSERSSRCTLGNINQHFLERNTRYSNDYHDPFRGQ